MAGCRGYRRIAVEQAAAIAAPLLGDRSVLSRSMAGAGHRICGGHPRLCGLCPVAGSDEGAHSREFLPAAVPAGVAGGDVQVHRGIDGRSTAFRLHARKLRAPYGGDVAWLRLGWAYSGAACLVPVGWGIGWGVARDQVEGPRLDRKSVV